MRQQSKDYIFCLLLPIFFIFVLVIMNRYGTQLSGERYVPCGTGILIWSFVVTNSMILLNMRYCNISVKKFSMQIFINKFSRSIQKFESHGTYF